MLQRLKDYFYERAVNSKRVHPIYILPTLDGIKVLILNLILLVMGLVYANNYVLLFNFVLFCLFLGSMFYTHFNLSGLSLTGTQFPALYANEDGVLSLHFSSTNAQGHYFIRPYFKSSIVKINNSTEAFAISSKNTSSLNISLQGIKRGQETVKSLYVETLFPFNFFRCFTFFPVNEQILIYPERSNLKIHKEVELEELNDAEGEDYFIRDYQIGDSLKRVDWKKLAQTSRWYTRQFQSAEPNPILLSLDHSPIEETLKSICFSIHELHYQNIKYGLKLGTDVFIAPENSPHHLSHCLRELARYET